MKLAIVLFAVVMAARAHPGYVDPWASSHQVSYASAPHVVPYVQEHQSYVSAPVGHHQVYAAPIVKVAAAPIVHAHPVAVHQQVIKVPQPAPIPPLHPQPLNIKVPHTQSVRLPTGPVKIHTPHLIGFEVAAPEPAPVYAKHAVVAKPVHVSAPVHPW
ncbi:uncharacterized protein LOC107272718 isoform X1 [Cephus cinctus]|uniref:Uncharacterized protein LOC107272718 isoform X1 n=1 Tax=Cephus cinctus TaxID=211228 RepID=A0AAJ7CAB6_CEPCN|nr:uncharacterized protein LOC107272718 isoform X1 [Cephus cinctus]